TLGVESPDASLRFELVLMVRQRIKPSGSGLERDAAVKRHLLPIGKRARQLRDAIKALLSLEGAAAADSIRLAWSPGLDDAFGAAERLLEIVENVPKSKGGIPADIERDVMMVRLARIYEHATGKRPGVTRDFLDGTYSGNFFRIAKLVEAAT